MAKFFIVPFANSGTKTAVPDDSQPSGVVSYTDGYGPKYSLNSETSPDALNIERAKMNDILFDITDAIRQYQTTGTPDFITSADNGGVAFSYGLNALVYYDAGGGPDVYISLVASNTALPTDVTKWKKGLDATFASDAETQAGVITNKAVTPASLASVGFAKSNAAGTSVANEMVQFANTDGITVKRSTLTGLIKGASGVMSAAVAGTDYYAPGGTDVAVADGGTGRSAHTAYAVICGGTTTTAAQQSIASVGTAGQVLTSNGAGALPTFQAASATGRVVQQVDAVASTYANNAGAIIPADNTTPLVGEGAAVPAGMQLSITPLGASNTLELDSEFCWWINGSGNVATLAIFQSSTLVACKSNSGPASVLLTLKGTTRFSAVNTSARTYIPRYGCGGSDNLYLNGNTSTGLFNGNLLSGLRCKEYN